MPAARPRARRATIREVLDIAIELEKKTMALYVTFVKAFPRPEEVRNFWFGMARHEAAHCGALSLVESILDLVREDAADLQRTLGARDQAVMSDYLETVRELERRVQKTQSQDLSKLKLPEVPVGIPDSFDQHLNLMFDMATLAWQGNLTRILNYMLAAEVSGRTYNIVGVPDAFHAVSHHANDPAKKEKLVKIQTYHTTVFAKWLTKLANTPDGDGSLLDHSIILYGSNMSNSDRHNQFPLPTAIVGGGCGKLKGGQHLRYPDHTPLANVLLTMLDRAGVPIDKVGDSNGKFAEV